VPVYLQLAAILRRQIERGELAPRRPVPSKRQLTQTYGIAGGTVDKALAVLRGEGLVKTVRGRGIYVTAPEERHLAQAGAPPTGLTIRAAPGLFHARDDSSQPAMCAAGSGPSSR